jgi:hypothetical protein
VPSVYRAPSELTARVPGGSLDEDQDEQDGRQNETQAHGDSLGDLVRLEFRILCRGVVISPVYTRPGGAASTSSRAARVAEGGSPPSGGWPGASPRAR